MYRSKSIEDISGMITIYKIDRPKKNISICSNDLTNFLDTPNISKLVKILKGSDDVLKKAILTSLDSSINYTSIKPFINNDVILYNLLKNVNLEPIYTELEIKAIMEYISTKSNTSIIAKKQAADVATFFDSIGCNNTISASGSSDIDFTDRKAAARADGIATINDMDMLLYLRYGSSSGGSQNDRWRGMFSTASRHKDKMILFVVDGVEALQQFNLCKDEFGKSDYPNAIWSTVKYLHFIDFDNLQNVDIGYASD